MISRIILEISKNRKIERDSYRNTKQDQCDIKKTDRKKTVFRR